MERSRRKMDGLLLSFSAWMADRHPRPMRTITRKQYVGAVRRAMKICSDGGYSLLAGDLRTLRFVLGSIPPHPTTQNGMVSALRAFFDFLKAQGLRKNNPAMEIGRPPRIKTIPRPLSIDSICLYLDAAAELGIDNYAVAAFGLYMGLRCREIQHLSWPSFFEADGRLWCDVDGKGGKRARMYVHSQVQALLPRLREAHSHPTWLFPSSRPERADLPVNSDWPRRRHRESVAAAGIPYATLHQLRHSFATYLRQTGVDIAVVKEGLRHANLSSTEIYTAVLPDELATAMEGLRFESTVEDLEAIREQKEIEAPEGDDGEREPDDGQEPAGEAG